MSNPIISMICPNPDNHSPILYKFRNWTDINRKNLLIKNELFLLPPKLLNDPFDCRIYDNNIKLLQTDEQKQNFFNESLERNSELF